MKDKTGTTVIAYEYDAFGNIITSTKKVYNSVANTIKSITTKTSSSYESSQNKNQIPMRAIKMQW
ncbi:hypothetical protein BAZO_09686 [Schinkia azotoformans LMG 9581]|uniref:YD repeat-containing protein n=1 Tax=Schinkia azotoformans LMG 9581 TaxID=1131731 RepID=K6DGI9_SCHAZ|nr:hypothetical protein BAZO_09686 [Schinkia azotoformans LMG 9581]